MRILEPLESRTLMSAVTEFTLVNAASDQDLGPLIDGMQINLSALPSRQLNVRAQVSGTSESVRFHLSSDGHSRIRNAAPYALAGSRGSDYFGWTPRTGLQTLSATPFELNNGRGVAGASMAINFTVVDRPPLLPPAFLSAGPGGTPGGVALSWLDRSIGEEGFRVERSVDGSPFAEIASVGPGVASYSDTASGDGNYVYRVRAFAMTGFSRYSKAASTSLPAAIPAAPAGLTALAASPTQVKLAWTDGSTNEQGFVLQRSTDGVSFIDVASVGTDGTSHVDVGLNAGTTYYYRACAFNSFGLSAPTSTALVTTGTATADVRLVLVNADTDQDIMVLSDGATLDLAALGTRNLNVRADAGAAWQSVRFALDGNQNFRVESSPPYSLGGDGPGGDYLPWTPSAGTHVLTATPYTLDGGLGTAGKPAVIGFTVVDPPPETVPVAPSGLTARPTAPSRVRLTWSDNASDEAAYEVERSTGAEFSRIAVIAPNTTSYTVNDLTASTEYFFRVRATNVVGPSMYSETIAATTPEELPVDGTRPGPENTGPLTPGTLKPRGDVTITTDGTVLEGVFVSGVITISASNVTVRNFRVNAEGPYGIRVEDGSANVLIEDGEISGMSSAAIYGGGFTARRLDIHHSGADGIKPTGNVTVEGCWIRQLGMLPESHADAVQIVSGSNFVFRGNFFDIPIDQPGFRSNAAFMIQTNDGPIDNVLIESNWMNGGNYTLQSRSRSYGPPTNVRIIGNLFGRDYQFGVKALDGDVLWSDNRWWDSGALIPA